MRGPDCFKCRYLKITWDQAHPYACLAMGFKDRQLPSLVVRRESGKPCLLFSAKDPKPTSPAPGKSY